MTDYDASSSVRRLYWLTLAFGLLGFALYIARFGIRPAFGFLLGALGSLGNLWLFNWLSRSLAPSPDAEQAPKNPWSAGLFIGRYLVLGTVAYATVKVLDVSPVPVLFGLLASTAAVLAASILDLIRNFTGNQSLP